MQRQATVDRVSGEEAAKVVRGEPHGNASIVESGHGCQVGKYRLDKNGDKTSCRVPTRRANR